jgi:hypothetical protein
MLTPAPPSKPWSRCVTLLLRCECFCLAIPSVVTICIGIFATGHGGVFNVTARLAGDDFSARRYCSMFCSCAALCRIVRYAPCARSSDHDTLIFAVKTFSTDFRCIFAKHTDLNVSTCLEECSCPHESVSVLQEDAMLQLAH